MRKDLPVKAYSQHLRRNTERVGTASQNRNSDLDHRQALVPHVVNVHLRAKLQPLKQIRKNSKYRLGLIEHVSKDMDAHNLVTKCENTL